MENTHRKITTIKDRALQVAKHEGVSYANFCESIGMTYASFKGKHRESALNSDAIDKILTLHKWVNPDWLILGDGQMERKNPEFVQENTPSLINPLMDGVPRGGVPYYDVDFIGGFDLISNDQTTQPDFYIDFQPFNDADCWVNVTGKSMSPFISHGDIVALKKFEGWNRFLLYGEIYAVITDHFRTIKIVSKGDASDTFKLVPYSKSPEFVAQDIPITEITDIYQVKGSIKKFF